MSPPRAACGSPAAYRRHLRNGEDPCDPCREAYTRSRAEERQRARERADAPSPPSSPRPEPADSSQTIADLELARGRLVELIEGASASVLPGLVRELRAVRQQLDAARGDVAPPANALTEVEVVDEFTAARTARAARTAGA